MAKKADAFSFQRKRTVVSWKEMTKRSILQASKGIQRKCV